MKRNDTHVIKSIRALTSFLRNDTRVFNAFTPNKLLLKKLDLGKHIMSDNSNEVDAALDLTLFLLRYRNTTQYSDFSEDIEV